MSNVTKLPNIHVDRWTIMNYQWFKRRPFSLLQYNYRYNSNHPTIFNFISQTRLKLCKLDSICHRPTNVAESESYLRQRQELLNRGVKDRDTDLLVYSCYVSYILRFAM